MIKSKKPGLQKPQAGALSPKQDTKVASNDSGKPNFLDAFKGKLGSKVKDV
jgi:hypothetical protein